MVPSDIAVVFRVSVQTGDNRCRQGADSFAREMRAQLKPRHRQPLQRRLLGPRGFGDVIQRLDQSLARCLSLADRLESLSIGGKGFVDRPGPDIGPFALATFALALPMFARA